MAWVEQWVGADLDEGGVGCSAALHGDGLAEPHRVAQVGHPVVGIEHRRRCFRWPTVLINGIVGVCGVKSASALRNSGRIGSIIG